MTITLNVTKKHLILLLLVIVTVATMTWVAGCAKATEPFRDAGRGQTNDKAADLITMPDGFSNMSSKCDGPNRVYAAYKGDDNRSAIAVAPNDPRCTGPRPGG